MPRYKLILEYDGTGLVGWQRQPNGPSVQEILETAFAKLAGEPIFVQCAGRTDAGVHALGQVAHTDLPRDYEPDEIRGAINFHVRPEAVAVLAVERAPPDFHARLSATRRRYLYRILNRRAPPALERNHVWHLGVALDADAMAAGARQLLGHHDFTSFRASECQANTPMKTLDRLDVFRRGEEIHIEAAARSFLHHQVRNMVGTLRLVGTGQWQPEDVGKALAARDRSAAGPTAPPDGLYLVEVGYEPLGRAADPVGDPADTDAEKNVE
ncbi:MAG TPA: tRNA pseudouridine(38-40) synthase TruA [Aliidongia sp.]|nr:tRNA pseudouridine(38-40) synthase TruA [Aliidongia sp.]